MKARIDYYCEPAKNRAEYDAEEIHMYVDLPFVPSVGMLLKLTKEGEYIKINNVMLDVSPEGEGLIIGLEEPEEDHQLRPWPEMKAQGWKIG